MPIFFHIKAHITIAVILLLAGLIVTLLLKFKFRVFNQITKPLEAVILSALFISVGLNGLILWLFDLIDASFDRYFQVMPSVMLLLVLMLFWAYRKNTGENVLLIEWKWQYFSLYLIVFLIIFSNGGLIERPTDAWYHMSYANKIGLNNSFSMDWWHLTGDNNHRTYPQLWHANLYLLSHVSEVSIDKVFNAVTAWMAMFKVMAYFLLALGVSNNHRLAISSALLFILLPGVGDSYLRVSAWPSHLSYIAMFVSFYIFMNFLEAQKQDVHRLVKQDLYKWGQNNAIYLVFLLMLASIMWFAHQLELLYFLSGILIYFIATHVQDVYRKPNGVRIEKWPVPVTILALLTILSLFGINLFKAVSIYSSKLNDLFVAYLFIAISCALILLCFVVRKVTEKDHRVTLVLRLGFTILGVILLVSISWRHLMALYIPELSYPLPRLAQSPLTVSGFLGDPLHLPNWQTQLYGFKLTGLLSIPLAWCLYICYSERVMFFCAVLSSAVIILCLSPYLYTWLQQMTGYSSVWRMTMLVFHPIVFASAFGHALKGVLLIIRKGGA